jgi:lysozyme
MNGKTTTLFLLILFTAIGLIVLREYYMPNNYEKSTKMYKDFGIRIPKGYEVHGIDVSHHQAGINWPLVKNMKDNGISINFAIIKSTEGVWIADKLHETNWKEAKEVGLKRGAYLYFHPSTDGKQQAEYFIKNTALTSGDLAPIVDIEETNGKGTAKIAEELKACLDKLEQNYKAPPIIYCNADFYEQWLKDSFDNYPLWVAHYQVAQPAIERSWDLWQHSDAGHVNGINGNVDFNVLNGNLRKLDELSIP